MQPLPQANQVFERVHCDLFGPIKNEEGGKSYILTMVDSFSKFALFKEIPNKEAETVAKCFWENWVSVFGSPLSIVTDGGTDLHTKVMKGLCDYLQIEKKVTTPQHPQSNAQAEVLNKRIARYLKAMVDKDPLGWRSLIPACQYSYNLSVHRALKNSPYSVLFGVDGNTPLNNSGFISRPIYGEEYHDDMANRLKAARQLAKKNNMSFRDDYVKRYNSKVVPHSFKEGQLVYLHRPELVKINPKIVSDWFGPFVILSMVGEANCLIQDLANRRTKFVNTNRLRPYNLTSSDWKKFKLLDKESGGSKVTNALPNPDNEIGDTGNYALFEPSNEVVVLTPEAAPKPIPIKQEQLPSSSSVVERPQVEDNVSTTDQIAEEQAASGGKSSFISGMAGELLSLVSPGKKSSKDEKSKNKSKKEQQAKIRVGYVPMEGGGSLTRQTSRRAGMEMPPVHGDAWHKSQSQTKKF